MSGFLWGLISAALAGSFMAIQGSLNAILSKKIGLWETNLIVHVLGVSLLIILVLLVRVGDGAWSEAREAPWYSYLGGVFSILIIYGVAAAISKVGVTSATTSIVFAQLVTAALIDHFGLFGLERIHFDLHRGVGLLFLIIGARLILGK